MTYYNQYEAMEWGTYPHQGNLMDTLLQRSALRYVANAHTPTLLMHGENDNDVPIAEAEQFYIALKDVGTEAVMVRYPREGHGIRESKHVVDQIDRSIRVVREALPAEAVVVGGPVAPRERHRREVPLVEPVRLDAMKLDELNATVCKPATQPQGWSGRTLTPRNIV